MEGQSRVAAFAQALETFGWTVGRNLQTDVRWGATDAESQRRYAAELVALAPDVILASASTAMMAVQQTAYALMNVTPDNLEGRSRRATTRSARSTFDTVNEPWAGFYFDSKLGPEARSNYALREATLAAKRARKTVVAKPDRTASMA